MMLDRLKGINKEREVKERGKTNLEYLLEISQNFIYRDYDTDKLGWDRYRNNVYERMYEELKKKSLSNIIFNEEDLTSFIFATASSEYEEIPSLILGFYSGCLLHLLTERNRKKGERTQFYINGQGCFKYDYLFYYAKEFDELIVDNFLGNHLCDYVGSNNGMGNLLVLLNNKGEIASEVGSYEGKVNSVILINNKGDMGSRIGDCGDVDFILGVNNQGHLFGECEQHKGLMLLVDCKGTGMVSGNPNRRLNKVVLYNVEAEGIAFMGNMDTLVLYDVRTKNLAHDSMINFILQHNLKVENIDTKYSSRLIEYGELERPLEEIIDIVNLRKNKPYPAMMKEINEIYSIFTLQKTVLLEKRY